MREGGCLILKGIFARKHFQKSALRFDGPRLFQYGASMESELSALEEKVELAVAQLKQLRTEARDLRQQLAARTDENARLAEKLASAKARIEALLKQIPETES